MYQVLCQSYQKAEIILNGGKEEVRWIIKTT